MSTTPTDTIPKTQRQTHLVQADHLHVLGQRPPRAHAKTVLVHPERRGPEELIIIFRVLQDVLDPANDQGVEAVVEPGTVEGPPDGLPEFGLVPADVDVRQHVDRRGEDVVAIGEGPAMNLI